MHISKKILIGVVLNGLALYVVTRFLPDIAYTGGFKFFIIGGIIIGTLNTFLKPLMKLLSLPMIFLSGGLFILVINVIIFWLTVKVINGIHILDITLTVKEIWTYLIAAVVFGLINFFLHLFIHNK